MSGTIKAGGNIPDVGLFQHLLCSLPTLLFLSLSEKCKDKTFGSDGVLMLEYGYTAPSTGLPTILFNRILDCGEVWE